MRILIFHGYLLSGTGSNVYNARLAEALVRLGHEVHLLSQDRHPDRHSFVDAVGDWDAGTLHVHPLRPPRSERSGRCTVYRPNIGDLLPVYVADRYEGIQARTFAQCTDEEVARYIDANVAAVRELLGLVRPEVALANHLVMGPVILARAFEGRVPYAVKIHGSALEYTVKPQPERFLGLAREGVAGARAILVGSHHTAASLWRALGDDDLPERTRLGPPGVDIEQFAPRDEASAVAGIGALLRGLRTGSAEETDVGAFARDEVAAAEALGRLEPGSDRLVAFVGKLIVSKGIDLLIAAWPLVLERVAEARLVVVGFGAYREGSEALSAALCTGDIERVRQIAAAGRALEARMSDPAAISDPQPLRHLLAFIDGLQGRELERYLLAARALHERVLFTGRLDHEELAELLPACEAVVVPSTFPESFGMVAVEAAACGALPISAAHSGLADVSETLAGAVPQEAAGWLSFPVDDAAVRALAARLLSWLTAAPAMRSKTRAGLVSTVRQRWSWDGVARGVIAAARGELDGLARP